MKTTKVKRMVSGILIATSFTEWELGEISCSGDYKQFDKFVK